jgi:tetratricopeptide (TPR) repeat protein
MRSLAEFYMNQMRLAEADSLIYGSLAMTRQLYGEQADDTNRARLGVAEFLQRSGRLPAAEAALTDLLAVARKGPQTDPELLPDVLHRLATTIVRQGRDREALPLFEESIALYTALAGADHPYTLLARNDCARSLVNLGEDAAALQQLQIVLETRERVLGPSNPETAITRVDLGRALSRLDRLEEAEASMRRGRDDYRAAKGAEHPGGWNATMHLSGMLRDLRRYDEATKELQACRGVLREAAGRCRFDHAPGPDPPGLDRAVPGPGG